MKVDHLSFTQLLIKSVVKMGDHVCDMTLGNGHDMRLLLEQIGPNGFFHGFDIQSEAIDVCQKMIDSEFPEFQTFLHYESHKQIHKLNEEFSCIVYNLGYLPGGDKTFTTHPRETLHSLLQALHHLKKGGILLLTAYGGHDSNVEREIILLASQYLQGVDVYHFEKCGPYPNAPSTLVFQKKGQ